MYGIKILKIPHDTLDKDFVLQHRRVRVRQALETPKLRDTEVKLRCNIVLSFSFFFSFYRPKTQLQVLKLKDKYTRNISLDLSN